MVNYSRRHQNRGGDQAMKVPATTRPTDDGTKAGGGKNLAFESGNIPQECWRSRRRRKL